MKGIAAAEIWENDRHKSDCWLMLHLKYDLLFTLPQSQNQKVYYSSIGKISSSHGFFQHTQKSVYRRDVPTLSKIIKMNY